jgi:multiple sugar transport system substrate-binding protein
MKFIRHISVIVFIILPFIAACSKIEITPEPEPVTISFAFALANDRTNESAYFEAIADQFTARYPNITVEIDPVNRDPLLQYSDADVFLLDQWDYAEFKERGMVMELGTFIEMDESFDPSDFFPGTIEYFSDQGQTWAIPAGMNPGVMYYNKDLFDRYGVEYPQTGWTWDDFLAATTAISHPGENIFGYVPSGFGPVSVYYDSRIFINQHGGRFVDDWRSPTRVIFDDPLAIEALEWYADLYHLHSVAPTYEQAEVAFGGPIDFSVYMGIYGGAVGIWIGTLSERGGRFHHWQEWPMRWGAVSLPLGEQPFTYAYCDAYVIASQTQNPGAAWNWLAFLTEQLPLRVMPARKSLAQSEAFAAHGDGDIAAVALSAMEGVAYPMMNVDDDVQEELTIFMEAVDRIIEEGLTPQEAMSWAKREAGQ